MSSVSAGFKLIFKVFNELAAGLGICVSDISLKFYFLRNIHVRKMFNIQLIF